MRQPNQSNSPFILKQYLRSAANSRNLRHSLSPCNVFKGASGTNNGVVSFVKKQYFYAVKTQHNPNCYMAYNKKKLIKAVEQSFKMYKLRGPRSTEKLKPIHQFVADTLSKIFGETYKLHFIGYENGEMTVTGKYYQKDIDITVSEKNKPIFCLGIKFVTSNYKQNANNYFENMMGETANIQATQIPYAQFILLRMETPYYKKNETIPSKIEIISDKDISKYLNLMLDCPQAHRPNYLGIQLIDIDEKSGKVALTNLDKNFKKETARLLKGKLSLANFFSEIEDYKNYIELKK